jgi:hypothetical protein
VGDGTLAREQRRHAPALLANRLALAHRWGRPCLAYHACVRPGPRAAAALARVQAEIFRREPSVLCVPGHGLHANVVWLLPSGEEFAVPKDELWRRNSAQWLAVLAGAARRAEPFRLRFHRLLATGAAVAAVAAEPSGITSLRRMLSQALDVPGSMTAGELAHLTLLRYGAPLADPAGLLGHAVSARLEVTASVRELLVVRETVFPCLRAEVLARLPLGPGG